MTVTLDDIEHAAWHLAAEPIPARMDELLDVIQRFTVVPEPVKAEVPEPMVQLAEPQPPPLPARKRCSKCSLVKDIAEFNKDASTRDKHRYACRPCDQKQRRQQERNRQLRKSA